MPPIVKDGVPSLATKLGPESHFINGIADEAITAGDQCQVFDSGGLTRIRKVPAAATPQWDGQALESASAGEAVTLVHSEQVRYAAAAALAGGQPVYPAGAGGAAGGLQTEANGPAIGRHVGDGAILLFSPTR